MQSKPIIKPNRPQPTNCNQLQPTATNCNQLQPTATNTSDPQVIAQTKQSLAEAGVNITELETAAAAAGKAAGSK